VAIIINIEVMSAKAGGDVSNTSQVRSTYYASLNCIEGALLARSLYGIEFYKRSERIEAARLDCFERVVPLIATKWKRRGDLQ
jgi:hypothetical protein